MSVLYRVAEFAQLAGVTVRALQYYDRIGLLRPAQTSEGGHRLYARRDLLRLQQILTLKWMGFKLDEIKGLLERPEYDLRTALRLQKAAIDSQLAELREASAALEQALASPELEAGLLGSDRVAAVIRAVSAPAEARWARDFYTDEAWAGIAARRTQYSTEELAQFTRDWEELIAGFAALRHLPPDDDRLQRLAATMAGYLEQFTAGDAETIGGLRRMWESDAVPAAYRMADRDLEQLMRAALDLYLRRNR